MKKGIFIALIGILILGGGLFALSFINFQNSSESFVADGFMLDPSYEEYLTDDAYTLINFNEGVTYREKYGTSVKFKDANGNSEDVTPYHFLHYTDGSLGTFTKGALVDVSSLTEENQAYYSLTKNTVLVKNGDSYELTSKGETIDISNFLWKISDTDYILVSPTVTLHIGDQDVEFEDYVQITYVDDGIVRLSHEDGTYQTVATDSTLTTENGATLNLVSKGFYDGEDLLLALDNLAIEDSSYLEVDENSEDYSDQQKIPEFVVEEAENGDEGTSGEEGTEGDNGNKGTTASSGTSGGSGSSGTSGSSGSDGVEGDTGTTGLNGGVGNTGKSATNAGDASEIASVDLNARPSISLDATDSGSEYSVSSNSANMTLSLKDDDESLVKGAGTTKVKLYNKDTMELVNSEQNQLELGSLLENNGTAALSFGDLLASTNYLIEVEADYTVSDGVTYTSTIFTKTFRTDDLPLKIEKVEVQDHQVTCKVTVSDNTVTSYKVQYYYYEDGTKTICGTYTNSSGSNGTYTLSDDEPSDTEGRSENFAQGVGHIASNTTYYAEITDLVINNKSVNSTLNPLSMTTLKQQPYDSVTTSVDDGTYYYVNSMETSITTSQSNHTITLSVPNKIADPDSGIKSYIFELYSQEDYSKYLTQAATVDSNGISSATLPDPVYTKEITTQGSATFTLPDGDNTTYIGMLAVEFDNNENVVTYRTMASSPAKISSQTASYYADIVYNEVSGVSTQGEYKEGVKLESTDTTAGTVHYPDKVSGYVRIYDPNNQIAQYISETYPLTVTIAGEKMDIQTVTFKDLTGATRASDENMTEDATGSYYFFPFTFYKLYSDTFYSVSVTAEYDVNGNLTLDSDENRETYLAGARFETSKITTLSLLGAANPNNSSSAFAYTIALTSNADSVAEVTSDNLALYNEFRQYYGKYESGTIENITFRLYYHSTTTGKDVQIGDDATLVDRADTIKYEDGTFKNVYVDRGDHSSDIEVKTSTEAGGFSQGLMVDYTSLREGSGDDPAWISDVTTSYKEYVLTPASFGLEANDSRLYEPGYFIIKAVSGETYAEEPVSFYSGEDYIAFTVKEKHLAASDPNSQVDASLITNEEAGSYKSSNLDDDTVVGIKFQSEYGYKDFGAYSTASDKGYMVYTIYEVSSSAGSTESLNGKDGTKLYAADTDKLTPVLVGVTNRKEAVLLYFDGLQTVCQGTGQTMTWYDPDVFNTYLESYSDGSYDDSLLTGKALSGTADGTYDNDLLQRGKRYVVAYSVLTANPEAGAIRCVSTNYIDWYPMCCTQVTVSDSTYDGIFLTNKSKEGNTLVYNYYDGFYSSWSSRVALYRSDVLEAPKEVPTVERYPYTSGTEGTGDDAYNYQTYMYHIFDPDNALVSTTDADTKKTTASMKVTAYATATATSGTSFEQEVLLKDDTTVYYSTEFQTLKIGRSSATSLTDQYYYTETLYYQLLDTDSTTAYDITSAKEQYQEVIDSDPSGIRLQGLKDSSGTSSDTNVATGTGYCEKAIINDGGYRYKLTVRGEDLDKYVAYKVTVTGYSTAGTGSGEVTYKGTTYKEIEDASTVFDPVYLENNAIYSVDADTETGTEAEEYGIMYLDTAPLQEIVNTAKTAGTEIQYIVVNVQGYYDTNVNGFYNYYLTENAATNAFADYVLTNDTTAQQLYALKRISYGTGTSYSYLTLSYDETTATNSLNASSNVMSDIYLPGYESGGSFVKNSGLEATFAETGSSAKLHGIYPAGALVSSSSALGDGQVLLLDKLSFNESGLFSETTNMLYSVDLLALSSNLTFTEQSSTDYVMEVGDILPATQYASRESNIDSFTYTVDIKGTGGNGIYAMLYQCDSDGSGQPTGEPYAIPLTKKYDSNTSTWYFEADKTTITYYSNLADNAARATYSNTIIDDYYKHDAYAISVTDATGGTVDNTVTEFTSGASRRGSVVIRGLSRNTNYKLRYFTYDDSGNIVDLYSTSQGVQSTKSTVYAITGTQVGYLYSAWTSNAIELALGTPTYIYERYDSGYTTDGSTLNLKFASGAVDTNGTANSHPSIGYKRAQFTYNVVNSEGSGITLYYYVLDSAGNQLAGPVKLNPNGDASYQYYSSDPAANSPIVLNMLPTQTDDYLRLNTKYTIRLVAYDSSALKTSESYIYEANQGTESTACVGSKDLEFTTPTSLKTPSLMATYEQSTNADNTTVSLNVTVSSNDKQKAFVGDKYYITLTDNADSTSGLKDANGDGNPDEYIEVDRLNGGTVPTYRSITQSIADSLVSGHSYTLKVYGYVDTGNTANSGNYTVVSYMTTVNVNTATEATNLVVDASVGDKLKITFDNCKNFASVNRIDLVVYDETGVPRYSESITPTDGVSFISGGTTFDWSFDWTSNWEPTDEDPTDTKPQANTTYKLSLRYYHDDTYLGGNDATVTSR